MSDYLILFQYLKKKYFKYFMMRFFNHFMTHKVRHSLEIWSFKCIGPNYVKLDIIYNSDLFQYENPSP